MPKLIDLTGKTFSYLTIIERAENKETYKGAWWKCVCICGNITIVSSQCLIKKHTKSCGCYNVSKQSIKIENNKNNFIGNKFERLTVIDFSYTKGGYSFWKCLCECGNTCVKNRKFLINKKVKSCGCLANETKQNLKQYMMNIYGVDHCSKLKDIQDKITKSSNNSGILYHWKTNEELIWRASYERKTIEWLNKSQFDFEWQNYIFTMPDGRTYRPDLFFPQSQTFIEIKGYFRKDALEKWEWFKSTFDSLRVRPYELWDKQKLKEIGIL